MKQQVGIKGRDVRVARDARWGRNKFGGNPDNLPTEGSRRVAKKFGEASLERRGQSRSF